jgi:hypothetical protein
MMGIDDYLIYFSKVCIDESLNALLACQQGSSIAPRAVIDDITPGFLRVLMYRYRIFDASLADGFG